MCLSHADSAGAALAGAAHDMNSIVLPLKIYPNREDSVVIARRSEATTKQSPDTTRGDCFARKTLARNDDQVWLRL
jgi:hypothetical protein